MNDRQIHAPRTLSAKLLLAALLSLLCALLTFALVYWVGTRFVNRYYMSADAVASRRASIYSDLNRYVSENNVSGRDTDALDRFVRSESYVSVSVWSPESLRPDGASDDARTLGVRSVEPPQGSGLSGRLYPLRFSDGIYYVSIVDSSRTREDMLNRGMAAVFAVVVLVAVLLWYTNRLSRRISRLSAEAANIGGGDLEGVITVDGVDEIAALAADIESMRNAIIQRMGNEKRAWEANSELITAVSHDIRTPMTSLIGYLDLLNASEDLPEEEQRRYLKAAYGKSLALKELTDELFKYFLVFGTSELELESENFDAHMLLMQLLGEAEFDLLEDGLNVQSIDLLEDGSTVYTDPGMLKRVIDNMVSNIKKYADRSRPVIFLTEKKDEEICVTVSNTVSGQGAGTESTKIGLRTCEKIMQSLGGSFTTLRDEGHFAAEFRLPVSDQMQLAL